MESEFNIFLEEGCNTIIYASKYVKDNYNLTSGNEVNYDYAHCSAIEDIDKRVEIEIKLKLASMRVPVFNAQQLDTIYYNNQERDLHYWMINPDNNPIKVVNTKGEFSISLVLMHDSSKLLSVMSIPIEDKLYFGSPSMGLFVIDKFSKIRSNMPIDTFLNIAKPITDTSIFSEQESEPLLSHISNWTEYKLC